MLKFAGRANQLHAIVRLSYKSSMGFVTYEQMVAPENWAGDAQTLELNQFSAANGDRRTLEKTYRELTTEGPALRWEMVEEDTPVPAVRQGLVRMVLDAKQAHTPGCRCEMSEPKVGEDGRHPSAADFEQAALEMAQKRWYTGAGAIAIHQGEAGHEVFTRCVMYAHGARSAGALVAKLSNWMAVEGGAVSVPQWSVGPLYCVNPGKPDQTAMRVATAETVRSIGRGEPTSTLSAFLKNVRAIGSQVLHPIPAVP